MQHLSGYHFKLKFDPALLFKERFQYQNRIASEFNTLYHWHPLMPDAFHIQDQAYSYKQFTFNNSLLMEHGVNSLVESFTKQVAGRVSILSMSLLLTQLERCLSVPVANHNSLYVLQVAGGRNIPHNLMHVAVQSIEHSRSMRYQSLNSYRQRFSMTPYTSFEELTGVANVSHRPL